MEKLRCSSCGAELQVEDNKEYAVCNHCGSKYKLNEDLNINIKLDDNTKEVINAGASTVKHVSKYIFIPIILVILINLGIIIYFGVKSPSNNINEENQKKTEENINKQQELAKKEMFNFQFTNDNGTKSAFFLKNTLDTIIQSNKTNERKVTLVFDGKETTDETEIINIKQSLDGDYEVSFDYDRDGYINKIIVEKK
jgi:DNA-directed RNA polymerase subunit M/transcription elongation factor TFIIS